MSLFLWFGQDEACSAFFCMHEMLCSSLLVMQRAHEPAKVAREHATLYAVARYHPNPN